MRNRLEGYLRAIDEGTVKKYHDHNDVCKGKMSVDAYVKKWGRYMGNRPRLKHD